MLFRCIARELGWVATMLAAAILVPVLTHSFVGDTERAFAYAAALAENRAHAAVLTATEPTAPGFGAKDAPDANDAQASAPPVLPLPEPPVFWQQPLFYDTPDSVLLGPIRDAPIEDIKFKRMGLTLSFKVVLANGAEVAFKPDQRGLNGGQRPRYEVAAFHINRLVGLASVPPAVARSVPLQTVRRARGGSALARERLHTEIRSHKGQVYGEFSWWIPVVQTATIEGNTIARGRGEATWKRYLTVGEDIPEEQRSMVRQISNLLVFDLLINNSDRWSGGNTKMSEDGTVLYFMDNTLAFGRDSRGHKRLWGQLHKAQKFSRSLIAHLRSLDENALRPVLEQARGPYPTLLRDDEIAALFSRRDHILAYVDELIATHGKEAVLAFR